MQIFSCLPCMEESGNELCFISHPVYDRRLRCDVFGQVGMDSNWKGWEVWRFVKNDDDGSGLMLRRCYVPTEIIQTHHPSPPNRHNPTLPTTRRSRTIIIQYLPPTTTSPSIRTNRPTRKRKEGRSTPGQSRQGGGKNQKEEIDRRIRCLHGSRQRH